MEHHHRHCQCCTLGDGTDPMLFLHDGPLIGDIDDMKMTVQNLLFSRLVLEIEREETPQTAFNRSVTGHSG